MAHWGGGMKLVSTVLLYDKGLYCCDVKKKGLRDLKLINQQFIDYPPGLDTDNPEEMALWCSGVCKGRRLALALPLEWTLIEAVKEEVPPSPYFRVHVGPPLTDGEGDVWRLTGSINPDWTLQITKHFTNLVTIEPAELALARTFAELGQDEPMSLLWAHAGRWATIGFWEGEPVLCRSGRHSSKEEYLREGEESTQWLQRFGNCAVKVYHSSDSKSNQARHCDWTDLWNIEGPTQNPLWAINVGLALGVLS